MKLSTPIYRLKRQAKSLARIRQLPLHEALDQVARSEGYSSWSQLAAQHAQAEPGAKLLARLQPGELLLVGARPGQGKTSLCMEVAVAAMKQGNSSVLFTLEYTESDVLQLFSALGEEPRQYERLFQLDNSDEICADYIVSRLASVPEGSVVVIDYLQVLDQRREHPTLMDQVSVLKDYARERGLIMLFISQVDRSFEAAPRELPTLADIRLPNPLDLLLFDKACYLNNGRMEMTPVNGTSPAPG